MGEWIIALASKLNIILSSLFRKYPWRKGEIDDENNSADGAFI
jgi:hypothetical protein